MYQFIKIGGFLCVDFATLENAKTPLKDVLRFATIEGTKGLHLDRKVGSLSPGKEADLILLDAEALNVAPLNSVPGAIVTLMEHIVMWRRLWLQVVL